MQVKTRITKSPDERRSELITTAQQLFYTQGYERTSVSDIVKTVGVAKGTFYYYFDSKIEILEALVDELTQQSLAVMHEIVVDPSLSAVEKWQRAFQTTAAWKTEHRAELITVLKMMNRPENLLLRYKLETQSVATVTPEIAKIIEQGVAEGVFEVGILAEDDPMWLHDTAEIALAIMRSASNFLAEIVLNSDDYQNVFTLARRKVAAVQMAVERVLGAPKGSLSLIEEEVLATWFEEPTSA